MRIEITCEDIKDAIDKLLDVQRDIDSGEDYIQYHDADEILYTDFGTIDFSD
jgi:hypothetical protein